MGSSQRERLFDALADPGVQGAAERMRDRGGLAETLLFGAELARAADTPKEAEALRFEAEGYGDDRPLPEHRYVMAFATPFPLRSLDTGLLDPEDVFLANADKFARVRYGLRESAEQLEEANQQIADGGVLSIRVPAQVVAGDGAEMPDDAEVHLYILGRDLRTVVEGIRARAHAAMIERLLQAVEA